MVAKLACEGKIRGEWFKVDGEKVWLRREGKQEFIPHCLEMLHTKTRYETRPGEFKQIKRKNKIQFELSALAKELLARREDCE